MAKVPDSIHEIESSDMYKERLERNKRSDWGLRTQSGEFDSRHHLIESQTYWQIRAAVFEKQLNDLYMEMFPRKKRG